MIPHAEPQCCLISMQEAQPSMGPDAELFAEMAQDLLLGPSQASMDARAAQLGYQGAPTGPHAAQYGNQPQAWQPPCIPARTISPAAATAAAAPTGGVLALLHAHVSEDAAHSPLLTTQPCKPAGLSCNHLAFMTRWSIACLAC